MSARTTRRFVHLRVHSTYSLGVGLSSPAEICAHARRIGYDAIALTDISGTYGFVEFHRAARVAGVKPIYGVILAVDHDGQRADEPHHTVILLALDRTGLRNLCAAASVSATRREHGDGFSVTDLEGRTDGIIAIAGLPRFAADVVGEGTRRLLASLHALCGDRLFAERRAGLESVSAAVQEKFLAMAAEVRAHPVLVQDARYVGPEKHQLIDLIGSADDAAYDHRVYSAAAEEDGRYHGLKSANELAEAYDRFPEAHTNASLIAALVQRDILDEISAPVRTEARGLFDTRGDANTALRDRIDVLFAAAFKQRGKRVTKVARERVDAELVGIASADLARVLLAFHEVAERLRSHGVTLGPMTGLRLQSLCAFLLGITTFDPYAVDAAFVADFQTGGRMTGTFDLQVPLEARDAIVESLKGVFDVSGMGYVPSVEHITAARALRIVGRRLDIPQEEYEDAARIAGEHAGVSLMQLCEENRAIGAIYRRSAAMRELVSHAAAIEGLPFGFVRSKRTIVVSPYPLRTFLGHTVNPETGDHFVQSTRESFPIGAISRVDVATLGALSVVARVRREENWMIDDDPELYLAIPRRDLDGVYLLEAPLTQRLAVDFGIRSFDDLVVFVALMRFRRGDLSFADRAKAFRARDPLPADERTDPILAHTNGWVIFTDQLRDVISALTGLEPTLAVRWIRRFRSHDPSNLALLRREFLAHTVEVGVSIDDATRWFSRILRTAGRTVDRQRTIAEAALVRMMLYLMHTERVRYHVELLNHTRTGKRLGGYLATLQNEGRMLRPDIHHSGLEYVAEGEMIRPPLRAVDGVSDDAAKRIVEARGDRRFADIGDFNRVTADKGITYREVKALVRAGAFESAGTPADAELPAERAANHAARTAPELEPVRASQYSLGLSADSNPPLAARPAQTDGNTRSGFRVLPTIAEFYSHQGASHFELAGRVRDLQSLKSSSGERVGFFVLFDSSASVQVFVPWERVVQLGQPLNDGDHVLVRGKSGSRTGKKVFNALELVAVKGGPSDGETAADESATRDS